MRHVVGTVANRVSQVDQDLVERAGRLVPLELLRVVGGGRFPCPELLQRRDLRPQLLQRSVETGRGGVDS